MATKRKTKERISDLELARESERAEELRAENLQRQPWYRPEMKEVTEMTREEFIAAGYHPDSWDWDGADKGL